MGSEAPDVVNGALGDHETHPNHLMWRDRQIRLGPR
jgi:hypothetical protein